MKRRHLVELEDLPWWPRVFRDAETDYLVTALHVTRTYSVMVPRLAKALKKCGATQIIDLCSGGGGPWADLLPALQAEGVNPTVCLTDKYPRAGRRCRRQRHQRPGHGGPGHGVRRPQRRRALRAGVVPR
jgi:hypothetical protein